MDAEHIDTMLAEGIAFETIENRIERADLPMDVKSTLWLYLWAATDIETRRAVVREMLVACAYDSR